MQASTITPSPKTSFSLFGITFSTETWLGSFLRKCLDTSVTGKLIGMLVVSLLGFALLISFDAMTLREIARDMYVIRDTTNPQYKVSQYILRNINGFKISLLYTLEAANDSTLTEDNRSIIANTQRLADLNVMIKALQNGGPVLDVAKIAGKTLDVFTVGKTDDPQLAAQFTSVGKETFALEQSFNALIQCLVNQCPAEEKDNLLLNLTSALDKTYVQVISMTVELNKKRTEQFKEMEALISFSISRSFFIGLAIAAVLTVATLLYIYLIATPLKSILKKITDIAKGESDRTQHIAIKSNDEVGKLAHQLNILVDNIYSLNSFKAIIEEEESTTEINQRLARLLHDRYHLGKMYIYELTGTKNNMSVAYASDFDTICSPEILDDANFCRAKRTGHPISSLETHGICKQFPHQDIFEHHCIPMIANGKVVGVVQFLHEIDRPVEEREKFEYLVRRASRYIKEATPVIEAKRFASALHETTLRDPMTDLYNRRFLETYTNTLVASTMRRATRVGILMCDMDFFKQVNDTYGHETGDLVLIKTAEVLKSCVRASDMVIRYGGEEFVILLIDVKSSQDTLDLAERIRSTMEATIINVPDGTLQKTLSIGASEFPGDTEGFWEAIKFADVALYRAKSEGRNRVVRFTKEMWKQEKY